MLSFIVLFALAGLSEGFWSRNSVYPDWDELAVTFTKFSSVPKTEIEARSSGWTLKKDACKETTFFVGKRYVLDGDNSTMLLFDKDGRVAGMQMSFPSTLPVPKNRKGKAFMIEGDEYVLTSYFTDPKTICSGTRETEKGYVGDKLFLMNGDNDLMEIPLKESDIGATKWTKGKCFFGMGQHYWYDVSKNMDCEDFMPFFLLYNGGNLNGYGFATFGNVEKSTRVERPPQAAIRLFFQEKPVCIENVDHLSTQHVYLQRRPYLNFC